MKLKSPVYPSLLSAKEAGNKKLAVLIDPDKVRLGNLDKILKSSIDSGVDYFLIGGSLIVNNMLDHCLDIIREACDIPLILFPGNSFQLSYKADAILFLSLISGRNADLLIGHHVISAPFLKVSSLEIISTGYMLIDGGVDTTVSYISNTKPIPSGKSDIALCTAVAGEMLGLKTIYLEAGSGATRPVSLDMIEKVSSGVQVPVIVGGGIRTPEKALANLNSGADMIVIGNAVENNPGLIEEICVAVHGHHVVKSL
ncbi:MAG: geranylgeranylglyceryl/heptaprenylglyceryl phosphate synthase [Saprospiraceae bacterium]